MFRFTTPCFDLPFLGLPPYLKLPCSCPPFFHFISYLCLCFLQETNVSMAMTMAKLPHATFFSLTMSNYFFVTIAIDFLSLIPWLYVIPYTSLHVFTLPPYLDLIPCLYFTPHVFTILHVFPLFFYLCVSSFYYLDLSFHIGHKNP
jgi:hypothetical protein